MAHRAVHAFAVSAVLAALIWALSPALTGRTEPWDSDGPYYALALLLAGAVAGALVPRALWAHYLGAVAGQMGFLLLFLPVGPLLPIGAVLLLVYSLLFLAVAAFAAYLRARARRVSRAAP